MCLTLKRLLHCWAASLLLLVPAVAVLPGPARSQAVAASLPSGSDDSAARVIVRYRQDSALMRSQGRDTRPRHAATLARRLGVGLQDGRAIAPRMQALRGKGLSSEALAARLADQPDVEWAVVDGRKYATAVPNDPLFPDNQTTTTPVVGQWYLRAPDSSIVSAINAVGAWDISTGSASVTVAMLDTGVRFDHPDFKNGDGSSKLYPGFDFVSSTSASNDGNGRDSDASDPGDPCTSGRSTTPSSWHGTQTAGVVGAATDNGVGMAGVGYNTMLLPLRVLGECGGSDSDIIAAMYYAANLSNGDTASVLLGDPTVNPNPAKVISLSLGSSGPCNRAYQDAVNDLGAHGVSVVVSAGNSTGQAVSTPANCAGAIAVAAIRHIGTKVGFSSLGPEVAISAPGGNCINTAAGAPCLYPILTTTNDGTSAPANNTYSDSFNRSLGTSFSAPMVAGTIALMLAANPALTVAQVRAVLQHSARPFPTTGADTAIGNCQAPSGATQDQCYCTTSTCGAGMLDAAAAVARAAGLATLPTAVVSPSSASLSLGSSLGLSAAGSSASSGRSLVAYDWRITQGAGLASFSAATDTVSTAITAISPGTVTLRLTVTDSTGASDNSFATVQVLTIAAPTAAISGSPSSLTVGSAVNLTGVGTANGGRSIGSYQWTITSGSELANLQNASTSLVTLNATAPGVVTLQLQVTDSAGAVGTSSVTMSLVAAPISGSGGGGGGGSGAMSAAWLAALAVATLALAWPKRRERQASARGRH